MRKLIVRAVVTTNDDCSTKLAERLLAVMGEVQSCVIQEAHFKAAPEDAREVWVYCCGNEGEPLSLAKGPREFSEYELSDADMTLVFNEGVCIELAAYYPRSDRYGVPCWVNDDAPEMAAAIHGFSIIDDGFTADWEDTGDDSAESFWFKVALPAGTTLDCETEKEEQDQRMQDLCDRIRRNLTENEMQEALESAGFAVHETGQELVEALANAIEQGDVDESVLDSSN